MMESWGIPLVSFVVGVATGAAGKYLADKFTDQRRDKAKNRKVKKAFDNIRSQMPELITEMKTDFTKNENESIREFVILPSDKVVFNSAQPRFLYYENQHQNLKGKVDVLENHGYVIDVTVSNAPIYRITEEFWNLVLRA
ncbi:MAG: hypothetical protein C4530_17115 [Desulfobacteraceae bacterium]|nr:MAG: hypothetical protein C4530_17115 [Desulfobacteraceae bacterium]